MDLGRCMGRWYEIASIPSSFVPEDGVDTRVTYTLNQDETARELKETWSDGARVAIEGLAYKADPKSDEAKLKVKFSVPQLLAIVVYLNYWVLYLDGDYQYALIGEPTRNYLWILCRKTHLEDEIYEMLVQKAKDEGYEPSRLRKTPQSDPPPEGGPQDNRRT